MHARAARRREELTVGRAQRGARTYVAFSGGLDGEVTLGSRGDRHARRARPGAAGAGDRLALGSVRGEPPAVDAVPVPEPETEIEVTLLLGPRDDWLAGALDALHEVPTPSGPHPIAWASGSRVRR